MWTEDINRLSKIVPCECEWMIDRGNKLDYVNYFKVWINHSEIENKTDNEIKQIVRKRLLENLEGEI